MTPRYGHQPIAMKRVASMDDVDHVGDFAWHECDGTRFIMLALPNPKSGTPKNYIMDDLPVKQGPNETGKHWGWDGNEDKPTLTPSIHCIRHWHGWVRDGMLVEA
jgi:hypothetical protein